MRYCSPVTVPMMVCHAPPMQLSTRRPPSLTILTRPDRNTPPDGKVSISRDKTEKPGTLRFFRASSDTHTVSHASGTERIRLCAIVVGPVRPNGPVVAMDVAIGAVAVMVVVSVMPNSCAALWLGEC